MSKILVPVDFSPCAENAVALACQMGEKLSKEVSLIHIVEKNNLLIDFFQVNKDEDALKQKDAEQKLAEWAAARGCKCEKTVEHGKVTNVILQKSEALNPYLIVMGTHGKSDFKRFFLGSNTFKVATATATPVLSVNEREFQYPFKKMLLPIDQTEESLDKIAFTLELAAAHQSEVILLGLCTDESPEIIQKIKEKCGHAKKQLTEKGIKNTVDMVFGKDIAGISSQFAKSAGADLMVIMTEQEISPSNILNGPFAQQIIQHANMPVLSINPF